MKINLQLFNYDEQNSPLIKNGLNTTRNFRLKFVTTPISKNEQNSDELKRQLRFDPQIQQLESLCNKITKSPKLKPLQQTIYNPFEFYIKSYSIIKIESNKRKFNNKKITSVTSYRRRPFNSLKEKSQLTQWERVSQEYSDSFQ